MDLVKQSSFFVKMTGAILSAVLELDRQIGEIDRQITEIELEVRRLTESLSMHGSRSNQQGRTPIEYEKYNKIMQLSAKQSELLLRRLEMLQNV